MTGPLYIATKRYDSTRGLEWSRYVAWSGLTQLQEVVSLDAMLCPRVVDQILPEDWDHIVNEDFMLDYFTNLEYLVERIGPIAGLNLLCVYRNPKTAPSPPGGSHRFEFQGYDLVDVQGGISALTNCGGFPLVFANSELSSRGLLTSLDRTKEVRTALRANYPTEPHANCHLWAIFRATET